MSGRCARRLAVLFTCALVAAVAALFGNAGSARADHPDQIYSVQLPSAQWTGPGSCPYVENYVDWNWYGGFGRDYYAEPALLSDVHAAIDAWHATVPQLRCLR
jgi:hypothetical protein